MRIAIVVTHLLGTGHLSRALTLGRAFAAAGHAVTVISGGTPVPHLDKSGLSFVQLPALRSNGIDFSTLLTPENVPAETDFFDTRKRQLIACVTDLAPDVLMTELFPFGRRNLKAEFEALLETAQRMVSRPLVLSSIRDILAPPSKPAKVAYATHMIAEHYDGVLVHSDPDLIPLDISWPVDDGWRAKLTYTGFVAPQPPDQHARPHGAVLVSAGGGNVGDAMFDAACVTAAREPDRTFHLLVGGDDARRAKLRDAAPGNVRIEAPRPDFRTLLTGASASISMCGYNTAMDILQTGVPAVIIPFDAGQEVEQSLRAKALQPLPGVAVLRQSELSGETLRAALHSVLAGKVRPARHTGMDGAAHTVELVQSMLHSRQDP